MDMVVSRDVNDTEVERGVFPPTTTKLGRAPKVGTLQNLIQGLPASKRQKRTKTLMYG